MSLMNLTMCIIYNILHYFALPQARRRGAAATGGGGDGATKAGGGETKA